MYIVCFINITSYTEAHVLMMIDCVEYIMIFLIYAKY